MKILKIFGVVAGIHLFALILIFANPGCSSTSKPTPSPGETAPKPDSATTAVAPITAPEAAASPMTSAPISFNADAGSSNASSAVRFAPTRPGSPAASTLAVTPVTDVVPATTYTVKAGDTLWELGKKFKIPYAEIAAANNLKSGAALQPGRKLIIPSKTPAPAPAPAATAAAVGGKTTETTAAPASAGIKHTVKSGETLSAIAHTYGVKQGDIAVANNISDPQKIRPGMELVIPGWQATGKSSSKSGAAAAKAKPASTPPVDPKPLPNIIDSNTPPPSTATSDAPVLKVEDNPMTPAPKK